MKKRVLAILLIAVLFVLSMGTTAFATSSVDDKGTGAITVENAVDDKTYEAYKIFDVTYDSNDHTKYPNTSTVDDADDHYAYSIKEASVWFDTVKAYADTSGKGLTLTKVVNSDPTEYAVTYEDSFSAADFAAALQTAVSGITDSGKKTLTDGSVTGLDLGYWFVTTTVGTLCNLTTTNPTQTIYDKNVMPKITKTVDDTDQVVEIGQTLTYTIEVEMPDSVTGYSSYTFKLEDTCPSGLTYMYIEDVKDGADSVAARMKALAAIAKVKTYNHGGKDPSPAESTQNGFDITIDLAEKCTKDETAVSKKNGEYIWSEYFGKTLTVTYKALVNETAKDHASEVNNAKLTYSNDPNNSSSTDTSEAQVYVYTLAVDINKIDNAEDPTAATKLSGAGFLLYQLNGANKEYYQYDPENEKVNWLTTKPAIAYAPDETEKTWSYLWSSEGKLYTTYKKADKTASDEANFWGLDLDNDYYLEEVEAPLGYALLENPILVDITQTPKQVGEGAPAEYTFTAKFDDADVTADANWCFKGDIQNVPGKLLPSTGGMGTTLFYVIGALMAAGAAALLIAKRNRA